MNFFDNVSQNIKSQKEAEKAKQSEIDRQKASASKLQQMVNTLVVAKTPTGGQQ